APPRSSGRATAPRPATACKYGMSGADAPDIPYFSPDRWRLRIGDSSPRSARSVGQFRFSSRLRALGGPTLARALAAAPGLVAGQPEAAAREQDRAERPAQGGRAHARVLEPRGEDHEGDHRP